MLEFLVLGQVPGTHIQITFAWYLFAALIGLAYALHKIKKTEETPSKNIEQLKLL